MERKEIFIKRFSKITDGVAKKEIADIMGCSDTTLSKYLNPTINNFPKVEELCQLCDHFKVSLDWLLGREEKISISAEPSIREICSYIRVLLDVPECRTTEIEETVYAEETYDDYQELPKRKFTALFFPGQEPGDLPFDNIDNLSLILEVNNFIENYLKIKMLKHQVGEEIFEKFVQALLDHIQE